MNPAIQIDAITTAVAALRGGQVIGLPTETVYGLAADAGNLQAVRRIFELKGRPADHPLIVHLADASWLAQWAIDIPPTAWQLAQQFWPGPMTLILLRHPDVSDLITGDQDTIGLRVPAHPIAQKVLQQFGRGIAAPSANRFGRISPTRAAHVRAEFSESQVPIILDGGDCQIGIESTIVDLSRSTARILRPGHIGEAEILAVIGNLDAANDAPKPRVSGSLASHYAPRTPVELLPRQALLERMRSLQANYQQVATLLRGSAAQDAYGIVLSDDPHAYAHDLYAALRTLDDYAAARILIEAPPDQPQWQAIRDRLQRAAA